LLPDKKIYWFQQKILLPVEYEFKNSSFTFIPANILISLLKNPQQKSLKITHQAIYQFYNLFLLLTTVTEL